MSGWRRFSTEFKEDVVDYCIKHPDESKAQMFEKMPELKGLYSGREHEFSVFAVRNLYVEQF